MTINSETRVAGPFEGNDSTVTFPFAFKVFATDEVLVVSATAGVENPLVLGADYNVALNPDQNSTPGGSVTLLAPLATGGRLVITSALEYLQPIDLTNQGGFYPRVLNDGFDRLTILQQQLFERLSRALVFPISDGQVAEIPGGAARAGSVLAFDEVTGAPVVGPNIAAANTVASANAAIATVAGIAGDVTTVAANVTDVTNFAGVYYGPSATSPTTRRDGAPLQSGDLYFNTVANDIRIYDGTGWSPLAAGSVSSYTFSGDGLQTAFNLPTNPITKDNTQVYIDGGYQPKGGYSVSGLTLTFDVAPPVGENNIEVVVLAPLPVSPLTAGDITDLIELRTTAVRKDSATGAADIPSGTTAQRPVAPSFGDQRANSTTGEMEWWDGAKWSSMGGSVNDVFYENGQIISQDYTIPVGRNAGTFGAVAIADGVTVTVSDGSTWSIV